MAINFDKMKKKMSALNSRGEGSNKKFFWKPQDGEQTLRIVPDPDGDPFREFWFHYNVGDEPGFLCPKKNHGDDCPVCEFVSKLYNTRDEEDRKLANQLRAKQRFFSPVVVRNDEDEGVRLWGYSKTVYERLLNLVLNPDYGDISDPETGTDLVIEYGKKPGQMFPSTDVQPRRRASVLHKDSSKANEFVSTEIPFKSLFSVKTTQEVKDLFESYRNGTSDEEHGDVNSYNSANSTDEIGDSFKELLAS